MRDGGCSLYGCQREKKSNKEKKIESSGANDRWSRRRSACKAMLDLLACLFAGATGAQRVRCLGSSLVDIEGKDSCEDVRVPGEGRKAGSECTASTKRCAASFATMSASAGTCCGLSSLEAEKHRLRTAFITTIRMVEHSLSKPSSD